MRFGSSGRKRGVVMRKFLRELFCFHYWVYCPYYVFTNAEIELQHSHGLSLYRCFKCGYVLGPAEEDYKTFALKNSAPLSKCQPSHLYSNIDQYVLREYYCPGCGVMFEVDMVAKEEQQIWSVRLQDVSS